MFAVAVAVREKNAAADFYDKLVWTSSRVSVQSAVDDSVLEGPRVDCWETHLSVLKLRM
jgi:hypothetical protein